MSPKAESDRRSTRPVSKKNAGIEMRIAGCQVREKIAESANSLVYRAVQEVSNQPVILKMLKQPYPPPEKIAWFKREYELTRSLPLAGVIDMYSLATDQGRPVIVLEDFGGESLDLHLRVRALTLPESLTLSIQLLTILEQVHRHHIVHRDINPSNIVWNPATDTLKLIDFGISTALMWESPAPSDPNELEGTLAYISPEQTGRMNRAVDYRTDLYSLGVTLYELLTGRLPFSSTDALALVHAHLAHQPVPPHTILSDIPTPLSAIVLKLMAKNAEERYQSASDLRRDLQECLQQWQASGKITAFPIDCHNATDHFHIPQKLYGRESVVNKLLATFERVSQGSSEIVFVSGEAGIGKSSVVQEIYGPITQRRGYFIAGKFDQLHSDVPYASLTHAFRSLIRQLLTENEVQITVWRERLLAALGANGQVIIDLIPEVEKLIGPQPSVAFLPPVEAQNRLHLIFQKFIHVFTGPTHPLVLFLDDLQWADAASLALLQHIVTTPDNHHLLVIGAYRDNEVDELHPFLLMRREIHANVDRVEQIVVEPLGLSHVNQVIVDTLKCPPGKAAPLAALVLSKTNGNPFFLNEFLQSLYSKSLLTFDIHSHSWHWDTAYIQAQDITDNVVELLSDKIFNLEEETKEILKLAACIGNRFDLHTLSIISEKSPKEVAVRLQRALAERIILPLNSAYKILSLDVQGLADAVTIEYKFTHDRIQQAVYAFIPEEEKQTVHYRIGQLLLSKTPREQRESKIFDLVNHLNVSLDLIDDQAERDELATLNLMAGRKAKGAAAYAPAFKFFQVGLNLLGEESWEKQADLTLALHTETAESAYLNDNFTLMEQLSAVVTQRAKSRLDRIKIYEINLHAYTALDALQAGLKTGQDALALLQIRFPQNPSQKDIDHALKETDELFASRKIEQLVNLAEMTDPSQLAAMRILSSLIHITKVGFPALFPFVVLRMVSLSIRYGNTALSAQAYAAYGLILCSMTNDIDRGYRCGRLALRVVEKFEAKELKASTDYIVTSFIDHWKKPVRDTLNPLLEGYQHGLEAGDLNFAALNIFGYLFKAYWTGNELATLEQEIETYTQVIHRFKQHFIVDLNQLYRQVIVNLLGNASDPCQLTGEQYHEHEALTRYLKANHKNLICHVYLNKMILACLFQAYPQSLVYAQKTEEYLDSLTGTVAIPFFYLFDSLTRLALYPQYDQVEQKACLKRVEANQAKLRLWAQHAPPNHLHKVHLVEAERARVLGNERDAREHYDQAIDSAREYGYVNQEALSAEYAAKFYLDRGRIRLGQHYLRDAHYAYRRWGAQSKVSDLEARYPQFLDPSTENFPRATQLTFPHSQSTYPSSIFDLSSVVKASQAIWGEIILDKLLATLMEIVIENAGAQKGFLLLKKDGQLVIEAEGMTGQKIHFLQSLPVEVSLDLPKSIIRYVERTQESVVLGNAASEDVFTTDPYLMKKQPKSILCTPLVKQGQLTGILYLENSLTLDAFTPDRLEVLNLLAAEAAISIENARLYSSLEKAHEQLAEYSRTLEQQIADRTQALREKNRELELANQEILEGTQRKSRFLAGMSHELRTPMNAIIGFTRLVLRRAGDMLPVKQRENLTKVKESADQLLALINQLLDLSKIEAGRMEVHPKRFSIDPFLHQCGETVSPLLTQGVQLRCENSETVGEVYTDEEGLRHIVLNLLSNAAKFTSTGQIVVRATMKQPSGSEPLLEILIVDSGVGIAPQSLETIFEEFQQVDTGPQKQKGTGLGLPIAKLWAELLGGSIQAQSTLGKGSTFTVTIPAVYQTSNTPQREERVP